MNNDVNINEISISGTITNITETKDYTLFGLISNKYSSDNKNSKIFLNLSIYKDLYYKYKDLFFKGNKIFIKGYLNSYIDNNKLNKICITVIDVFQSLEELKSGHKGPHIRYDPDGVEVWNGQRCESTPCSPEDIKLMNELLSEYKDTNKECDNIGL